MTVGPFDCLQHVLAVPAATHGDQHIAGGSKVFELFDENAFESFVIGPCEDCGCILRKTHNFHTLSVVIQKIG